MGVSLYPVQERDVPGVDGTYVIGKALIRAVYEENVPAIIHLQDFVSVDVTYLLPEDVDVPPNVPALEWFEAADGLTAVRAALAEAQDVPLKADLTELESVLLTAQQQGVRFRLEIDI